MSNEWINDVASILVSKEGKLYLKVDKDVTLKAGDTLTMKSKKEDIEGQLKRGKITEDRAQELIEKLSFIKYTLHVPPAKDSRK